MQPETDNLFDLEISEEELPEVAVESRSFTSGGCATSW